MFMLLRDDESMRMMGDELEIIGLGVVRLSLYVKC